MCEEEPKLLRNDHPLTQLKRHIPIMHQNTQSERNASANMHIRQPLGKTGPTQLFGRKMEYVSMKKVVVDRIVEDPKTGAARVV